MPRRPSPALALLAFAGGPPRQPTAPGAATRVFCNVAAAEAPARQPQVAQHEPAEHRPAKQPAREQPPTASSAPAHTRPNRTRHEDHQDSSYHELMANIESLNRQIRQEERRASHASAAADAAARNATQARHQTTRVEKELSAVQQQLRAVHEEIDRMGEHLKAFEDAEAARQAAAGSRRRLGWLLAMGAGFSGLLAVLGPDTFQQSVVSLLGSFMGGLMVAAGVCCLFSPLRAEWAPEESGALGFMWRFVRGDGLPIGYAIWALVTAVGLVRWHLDCDWRGGACLQELGALAERRFPELLHNLSRASKKRRSGNPPRRGSGGRGVEASRTPSEEIRFNVAGGAGGREARGQMSGDVSLHVGREPRDHQLSREVSLHGAREPRRDVSLPSGEVSLQGGGREQHGHAAHAA